ncbi:unnamed protein product, partial [Adineta steineri]
FTSILQLVCTILYIFFIIYSIIIEIQLIFELRLKYFHQFWSIIQLGIIGCSLGSIGVYFWRFQEAKRISQSFEQTNGLKRLNQEEQDCRMRSQYFDPIENFPDRIDQLLEALNRIYIDQKRELSRLDKAGL